MSYLFLLKKKKSEDLIKTMVEQYTKSHTFETWCNYEIEEIYNDITSRIDVNALSKVIKEYNNGEAVPDGVHRTIENLAYRIDNRVFDALEA